MVGLEFPALSAPSLGPSSALMRTPCHPGRWMPRLLQSPQEEAECRERLRSSIPCPWPSWFIFLARDIEPRPSSLKWMRWAGMGYGLEAAHTISTFEGCNKPQRPGPWHQSWWLFFAELTTWGGALGPHRCLGVSQGAPWREVARGHLHICAHTRSPKSPSRSGLLGGWTAVLHAPAGVGVQAGPGLSPSVCPWLRAQLCPNWDVLGGPRALLPCVALGGWALLAGRWVHKEVFASGLGREP